MKFGTIFVINLITNHVHFPNINAYFTQLHILLHHLELYEDLLRNTARAKENIDLCMPNDHQNFRA